MTNNRAKSEADQTSQDADADTSGTEAVYRMIDLIARRTAERYAEGEFEDGPKLSRRPRRSTRT